MRRELLDLHRALVDSERRQYERARGRMTGRAFLEALISAPELGWLGPLTSLIVRLEEAVEEDATENAESRSAVRDCVEELRKLLRPSADAQGFQRRYAEAMQRSPEVVIAHGKLMRALPPEPHPPAG